MALLNAGLVLGLILAGWLALHSGIPAAGILLFTGLAAVPAGMSFFMKDPGTPASSLSTGILFSFVKDYRWLWISSIVLVGITGVVSSLYPQFSGASSESLGYWLAGMSLATIGAVLIASRVSVPPLDAIRWSAVCMVIGVIIVFFSPWGFAVIGILAGVVMIAQMAFLSGEQEHQGIMMGLFSTMSYLGMTILPFIAGLVADAAGFPAAFGITALSALVVAVTIGRSPPAPDRIAAVPEFIKEQ